jgi:hypothetical protein
MGTVCAPGELSCEARSPEFRTVVAIAGITVTGVLSDPSRQEGSIAISGDVHTLCCDQALELVDALLLVVMRIDVAAEKRCRIITSACRESAEAPKLESKQRSVD